MSSDSHKLTDISPCTKFLLRTVLLYQSGDCNVHFKYSGGVGQTTPQLDELFSRILSEHNEPNLRTLIDARVVGSSCQSSLLLTAAECLGNNGVVRFVTPRILRATAYTPADIAFDCMCDAELPELTLLGGWRPVGVSELRAYQFLNNPVNWAAHPAACVVDSLLPKPLQRRHKIVGDLPKPLKTALANLLKLIEDPRWFMTSDSLHEAPNVVVNSPANHYGVDELSRYFGVGEAIPTVITALSHGRLFEPSTEYEERLLVLLQVCLGLETCPLHVKSFNLQDINSVFTSLLRGYFKTIAAIPDSWDLQKCILSPSGYAAVAFALKTILLYMSQYWLHETTPAGWEFFVPCHFFDDAAKTGSKNKLLPKEAARKLADSVIYARSAWPVKLGYKPLVSN